MSNTGGNLNMLAKPLELRPTGTSNQGQAVPADQATTGLRYIGSKARVAHSIADKIRKHATGHDMFVDAFAGTGSVAKSMLPHFSAVHINDTLQAAAVLATSDLLSRQHVDFSRLGGYEAAIEALNQVDALPRPGFIESEYSPGRQQAGNRMYFTARNAARIDGIRTTIEDWTNDGTISITEKLLLLGDLLCATNAVANTAGTYGCYLSEWHANALQDMRLSPRKLANNVRRIRVSSLPAEEVDYSRQSIAYFDPPYTKRQYAAYYHILETIVMGDSPPVSGVTGLRPWQELASDFCYKRRASSAFHGLLDQCESNHIFISYSNEGHLDIEDLTEIAGAYGTVSDMIIGKISRYAPNSTARAREGQVAEHLLHVERRR